MKVDPPEKKKKIWELLGPGFITGASDDDPSGIATYSQAGAAFGLSTLWTALVTFPLMAAIQGMCARIGIVTSSGLTKTLKTHYSKALLYVFILISFPAIILNIGADIAGMGAVANMLCPNVHSILFSSFFVILLIVCLIYFPYKRIAGVLKWLCLTLMLYIIVPFLVKQDGWAILKATFVPEIKWNKEYIAILVAILGTTISPYLFFWQASQEVEEMALGHARQPLKNLRRGGNPELERMAVDTSIGMIFSNTVAFFIVLTTAVTLNAHNITDIQTAADAANALRPIAGNFAFALFALGIIGTGLLAIPVLAGSAAYAVAEFFGWPSTLEAKFPEARAFYIIILAATAIGFGLGFTSFDPIKMLVWSAVLNGIVSVPVMAIMMALITSSSVMGRFCARRWLAWVGWAATALMGLVVMALILSFLIGN